MRTEQKLKTLRIDESLHIKIKDLCDKNGLKIYKWIESALTKQLEKHNEQINN